MKAFLARLFGRKPAQAETAAKPARPVPRAVHVFTCSFDTEQGFLNYADQHWTVEDAEPYCVMEQDLGLSYLDRNYVELIQGTAEDIDAHIRPLLDYTSDADAVFLGAPSVRQAVLIYDLALPPDAPVLHPTPKARYVGQLDLKP